MAQRKLPIGIQDFEKLRTENFVYVDKTPWIYRLANESNPYFLGRPRRFGKSLLLSTIKAYFLGKRELFEALGEQPRLAMADLEKDRIEYPVFHIDLNMANYTDVTRLIDGLNANLWPLEEKWGRDPQNTENSSAPRFLIEYVHIPAPGIVSKKRQSLETDNHGYRFLNPCTRADAVTLRGDRSPRARYR
jgi:hypothetical protein